MTACVVLKVAVVHICTTGAKHRRISSDMYGETCLIAHTSNAI